LVGVYFLALKVIYRPNYPPYKARYGRKERRKEGKKGGIPEGGV